VKTEVVAFMIGVFMGLSLASNVLKA